MNIEHIGSFRTRTADDGSLEVWARGWRLESQLYALIPMGLTLMFLLAPMALPMRVGGAVIMLGASLFVFKMTKPGLLLTAEAISIVSVIRTQQFPWEQVGGFIGERSHDEARVLMNLQDGRQVSLPGTLDPEELDPYGDEGQMLSAADQLNHLRDVAMAGGLPAPVAPVVRAPAPSFAHATHENGSRPGRQKDTRRERKELRAALKSVRLDPSGTSATVTVQEDDTPAPSRRLRRRSRNEPAPELLEVEIADPEPVAVPSRRQPPATEPLPSYFPTPTYVPQAEYAQMLRDQKAAEKAAVEAAAELRRLADLEEIDELAKKEEFSDWTS